MRLFKKIKTLVGNDNTANQAESTEIPSPELLDDPPYTFVDALHAVRQGNLKKLQDYMAFNQQYARCKNWDDCTLLHEACHFAHVEMVKLLLDNGADINALYKGQSPLHFTVEGNIKKSTPEQYLAFQKRRKATINLLITKQADLTLTNEAGETPIHLVAKLGDSALMALLLTQPVAVEAIKNLDTATGGRTALLLATRYSKDKATIELLLDKGADPNFKDKEPGYAPLHYIAAHRATDQKITEDDLCALVSLLLTYGAEINAYTADKAYQTPLHLAINNKHVSVVGRLLENKADLHAKNGKGLMAIGFAASNGDAEMVKYLHKKGTDIYKSGVTFYAAACQSSEEALKYLLDQGVDVDLLDAKGHSLLYHAIAHYAVANVKLLIDRGADTKMNVKGKTILEHAFGCWGKVENLAKEAVSKEQEQKAQYAREIIELLGGFELDKPKHFF